MGAPYRKDAAALLWHVMAGVTPALPRVPTPTQYHCNQVILPLGGYRSAKDALTKSLTFPRS